MTSSTWTFNRHRKIAGCGIDLETVDRFRNLAENDDRFMPFVFTKNEIVHARKQTDAARVLCVCFCCKEAVRKAVREPYNYTECETFPIFAPTFAAYEGEVCLGESLKNQLGLSSAWIKAGFNPLNDGEMMTAVVLFKEEL